MELVFLVWFASIVSNLSFLLTTLSLISLFVLSFVVLIIIGEDFGLTKGYGDNDDVLKKKSMIRNKFFFHSKWLIPLFSFLLLFSSLLPDEKTVYLMAGAYATQKIAENDRVQKIGSDVLEVIEKELSELKGSNGENNGK